MPVTEVAALPLIQELQSARAESDQLFRVIKASALYERPIDARHRVIFYLGHLDGFDSIQICREGLGLKSRDPELDALFQAGIDPDSTHLPNDVPSDWPSVERVLAYVNACRQTVDRNLKKVPEDVLQMAIEHRLMHLETLAYMFHNFAFEMKQQPLISSVPPATESAVLENAWRLIPAGTAILGITRNDYEFGWDNEYDEVRAHVPAFQIQRYSVTNGDYLRFVRAGAAPPHFWVRRGDSFFYRGMFEDFPLPMNWPVYVTYTQAESYAAWLGKKLPTEEQFHRAAHGTPSGENRNYPWGAAAPSVKHGNFDFKRWDPESVYANPDGDSAFGVNQLVGNGWEWTDTPFTPFPGFQPRPTYPGYSTNFFDGEHYVLKGGSPRTAARLLRRSFRNWFRRDYPYVYAKFRCVEN